MNNLVLLALLAAISGFAWMSRYSVAQSRFQEVQFLREKLSACDAALQAEHDACAATDQQLAPLRNAARSVRESLVQASGEAKDLALVGDASTEGAWPKTRDYFYLPKQYLGKLGYGVFHNNGTLSEEAAALFGLTPAEKVQLADTWQQLRLDLEELQLKHAEPLDPVQPDSDSHREISFRLPALTNEISQLTGAVEQNLKNQLGNTRGQLIWEKVSGEKPLNGYPMGDEDRIVTLSADRRPDGAVQHTLAFTNPKHNRAYQFGIQFDLEPNQALVTNEDDGAKNYVLGVKLPLSPDSALWNYRHLFGDRPLLLPVSNSN